MTAEERGTVSGILKAIKVKDPEQLFNPEHFRLLCMLVSTPVTSVETERGFSLLKFVITVLRTGLREEQVNQLLFVHHHAPDAKDREGEMAFLRQVLAHWRKQKKRKGLSNNLSDFKKLDEVKQKKRKVIQMTLASSFTNAKRYV